MLVMSLACLALALRLVGTSLDPETQLRYRVVVASKDTMMDTI